MKIKVWYRITNLGDGSSSVQLYPTEELAWDGLNEDGFEVDDGWMADIPCEVDYYTINTEEYTDET
jgi:hypothetical protein